MSKLTGKICILLLCCAAVAQGATIKGNALPYQGQFIQLYVYSDFLTETRTLLDETRIAEDGTFQLKTDYKTTCLAELKIGELWASIYLEPNATHDLVVPAYSAPDQQIFSKATYLMLEEPRQDSTSLNALINEFNASFDLLADTIRPYIVYNIAEPIVTQFIAQNEERFGKENDPYFKHYRAYQEAMLKLWSRQSRKELFSDFLYNEPVLYHNDSYEQFVAAFYQGAITTLFYRGKEDEIRKAVEVDRSFRVLDQILAKTEFLIEPQLREYVMLRELYLELEQRTFKHEPVIAIINDLASNATYPEHRIIAQNMIDQINHLQPGTPAPDFAVLNLEGDTLTLADFEGKYLLLEFWSSWCGACEREMALTKELKKDYGMDFEFLSVGLDHNWEALSELAKTNGYDWHIAEYSSDPGIRDRYQLRALPTYFLIDPDGNLLEAPAIMPSMNLRASLHEIHKELHPVNENMVPLSNKRPPGSRN